MASLITTNDSAPFVPKDSTVAVTENGASDSQLDGAATFTFGNEYDNGSQAGASYTLDWNNGQKQRITLTGNITTLTLTAPPGVGNFLIKIIQDGTGGRTITWPASVLWPGGTAPTLSAGGGARDIITFYYDGTDYHGQFGLNFQ